MKCDWYSATIPDDPQTIISYMENNIGGTLKKLKSGLYGYSDRWVLDDDKGNANVTILAGGNNGANPNVFASGDNAIYFRELVREVWPEHSVTRIDVAEDMQGVGLFEELTDILLEHKDRNRVNISVVGDWLTDKSANGRTLYLGSPKSSASIRLYEKGKQIANQMFTKNGYGIPEGFPIDWVRLELQLRPKKQQKLKAASDDLVNFWGYSNWTKEVADEVFSLNVPRVKADEWKQTDDDRVMMWLARQYGNFLTRLLDKKGSWASVGEELGKYVKKMKDGKL